MDKTIDVVVSGHLCIDIIPQMSETSPGALSQPGRLYETGPMTIATGGAVANTGITLRRLGLDAHLMATLGDDALATVIREALTRDVPAAALHLIPRAGTPCSYSVVLSPKGTDRIFLHCTGTNALFSADDIDYEVVAQARLFHLGYPPLLPALCETHGEGLAAVFERVKRAGTVTSLDLSMIDEQGASGALDWQRILSRTLPFVDLFIPSIDEILLMLRPHDHRAWANSDLTLTLAYLHDFADTLLRSGVNAIAGFKLGSAGIFLKTPAGDSAYHPAFVVDVAGTTGAGDSAYAGLIAAFLKGLTLEEMARWACAVGASNVERPDATSGVRSWEDTARRLTTDWKTLPSII